MKKKRIKFGKEAIDQLYKATLRYVEEHKGSIVVIGGVCLVDEGDKHGYGIMVRCVGRKPVFNK